MDESHHQPERDHGEYDADHRAPAPIEQHRGDDSSTPTGQTQQEHTHGWRFRWPSAQAWFDFFLVLFTGALVITAYWQWSVLSDTLAETRRLVDASTRHYPE